MTELDLTQAAADPVTVLIVAVLTLIGAFLKKSTRLDNRYIPVALAIFGAGFAVLTKLQSIHSIEEFARIAISGTTYAVLAVGGHSGLQHLLDALKVAGSDEEKTDEQTKTPA